ncbi:serine protease [Myxosarcina sp. GI1]|uniref:S1 family peptidase n=1 Tax=Myxosarcina sp. GI1 TaxID=1541065 RepID=UPI00155A5FB4|nr:serine protease [Myxosarcina sp. GI1]
MKPKTAVKLSLVLAGVGVLLASSSLYLSDKIPAFFPNSLNARVNTTASKITVKILGENFLGSGFIIQQRSSLYTVITNQHVLRAGQAPYSIQTPDGKIYPARRAKLASKYDLALLQFTSDVQYNIASFGSSSSLTVGEPAFAAGYAVASSKKLSQTEVENYKNAPLPGFTLRSGRIQIILERALEEGYRIGYTNDVEKGMSGGPLFDLHGTVIGVNGKHAYPLWEAPDYYEDGSQPCPPLQELITNSSLAIPIEAGISLIPKPKSKPDISAAKDSAWTSITLDSDLVSNPVKLVAQMQARAKAIENCQIPE